MGEKELEDKMAVRIEKDERSSVGPSVGGASRKLSEDINWNRKTLRLAFSENPYEKYKTKVSQLLQCFYYKTFSRKPEDPLSTMLQFWAVFLRQLKLTERIGMALNETNSCHGN